MVTDANWVDINGDKRKDLVVVGELMSVTIFQNTVHDGFKLLKNSGLENCKGWWESVVSADIDNDGDEDLLVGNMGSNNFYRASMDKPLTVVAKDFDGNGSMDPVSFAYFKDSTGNFELYPVHFWGDLFAQSPLFRAKFKSYKEYAKTTKDNLLNNDELIGAKFYTGNYDKTSY